MTDEPKSWNDALDKADMNATEHMGDMWEAVDRAGYERGLVDAFNAIFVLPAASREQEQAFQMAQSAIKAKIAEAENGL